MSATQFAQQTARCLTGLAQMLDLAEQIDAAYSARGYTPDPPLGSPLGDALLSAGVPPDQLGGAITLIRALEAWIEQTPGAGSGSYRYVLNRLRGDV